jgi:hypothetical protein
MEAAQRLRATLPPEAVREWFQTYGEIPNWPAYYNAAPTNALPVVRQASESREIALMRWGLIPYFSKHGKPSYSTIIARSEGVQSAASYRAPFRKRRYTRARQCQERCARFRANRMCANPGKQLCGKCFLRGHAHSGRLPGRR